MTRPRFTPADPPKWETTPVPQKRVRASSHTLTTALKAISDAGLSVDKLLISGGRIELHIAGVDGTPKQANHGALEPW